MPRDDRAGWVLHEAHSDVGSWLRRSAAAHTLLLGGAFATLLLVLLGAGLRGVLPATAAAALWGLLLAVAVLAAAPLPLLAWRHARRQADGLTIDPLGLTLHTRRGARRIPFASLAEVRVAAEPAFAALERPARGPLHGLPAFHAALHLRETGGAAWEFVSARAETVAGVVAWLGVLGVGDRVRAPPSGLAATRDASDALRRAQTFLALACAAVASALAAVAAARLRLADVPHAPLLAAALIGLGCALYVASFALQARAARAWLEGQGLTTGPPVPRAEAAPAPVLRLAR